MRTIVARITCNKCDTIIESGVLIRDDTKITSATGKVDTYYLRVIEPRASFAAKLAYLAVKKKASRNGWETVIDYSDMGEPGDFDFCAACSEGLEGMK